MVTGMFLSNVPLLHFWQVFFFKYFTSLSLFYSIWVLQLSWNVSSINRLSICLMLTFLPLFWHVFVYTVGVVNAVISFEPERDAGNFVNLFHTCWIHCWCGYQSFLHAFCVNVFACNHVSFYNKIKSFSSIHCFIFGLVNVYYMMGTSSFNFSVFRPSGKDNFRLLGLNLVFSIVFCRWWWPVLQDPDFPKVAGFSRGGSA